MGTRSLTHIIEKEKTLTTIYRQYDGYLSGHGLDLAMFLEKIKIGNGIVSGAQNFANGMGCLSAQIIANLKKDIGNIYIYPPDSKNCGEEYTYFIFIENNNLMIKIINDQDMIMFKGTPQELLNKIK